MGIADKFNEKDRKRLNMLGYMMQRDPTPEEQEQERLFQLLEQASLMEDKIGPQIKKNG